MAIFALAERLPTSATLLFYTIFLPDGQNITFVWDSMFEDICAAEFVFL